METQNDSPIISDLELLELLQAAKHKEPLAMLKLIEIYNEDIVRISQYIKMPKEDAISAIIVEFLDLLQATEVPAGLCDQEDSL
ncbi:hypothetical protein [Paenibacillus sp. HW567]|uniref:hypothetical protein n=1 Tax=Paenibacillus sp. HW567 TaxID=1034769 RepID=UPI00039A8519|nr:hypothetical protein [Paenibacillus sp. HW567]